MPDKEGIFPHFSLFNHSCDPNTLVRNKKDMVMILAIQNIKKGEEICVPYIHLSNPTFKRRAQLLGTYGFECNCERCCELGDWEQKEAETTGLICPKCKTEVKCDNNEKFVCPNRCWAADFAEDEQLSNKVIKIAIFF